MLIVTYIVCGIISVISILGIFVLVYYAWKVQHHNREAIELSVSINEKFLDKVIPISSKEKYRAGTYVVDQKYVLRRLEKEFLMLDQKPVRFQYIGANADVFENKGIKKRAQFVRANDLPARIIDINHARQVREELVYVNHG